MQRFTYVVFINLAHGPLLWEETMRAARTYGTPLVTKIQDTQRHVQTTVTFKPPTSRSNNSTSRQEISQRHVERFLNVMSKDFSIDVTSKDFSTSCPEKKKKYRTVDVAFKTLKKVIAVQQLSRAQ